MLKIGVLVLVGVLVKVNVLPGVLVLVGLFVLIGVELQPGTCPLVDGFPGGAASLGV